MHDGMISDYCDTIAFQQHPFVSKDPHALQIMLYYDEVEVVNPLGRKTSKHKVGKKELPVDWMHTVYCHNVVHSILFPRHFPFYWEVIWGKIEVYFFNACIDTINAFIL